MSKNYVSLISPLVVFVFAFILYIGSNNLKTLAHDPTGPALLPKIVAIILLILGILMLLSGIREFRKNNTNADGYERKISSKSNRVSVYVTLAIIFMYIFLLDKLGFIISTSLYLVIQIHIFLGTFRMKHAVLYLIGSILLSVILFEIFSTFFNIMLPRGIFN